jgi:hypothetical protein
MRRNNPENVRQEKKDKNKEIFTFSLQDKRFQYLLISMKNNNFHFFHHLLYPAEKP